MSKHSKKNGLLTSHSSEFVEVEHQSLDFNVRYHSVCPERPISINCSIPYFRVFASLVLYAVNHLEPDSPLAGTLQNVLFEDFSEFFRLIGEHPEIVKQFENAPR